MYFNLKRKRQSLLSFSFVHI